MTATPADPALAQAKVDARKGYRTLEPLHAFIYFAPGAAERYTAAGLKGGHMQYFASRGAALGPVGPGPVIATFYNFAPAVVARALPDAWSLASVDAVLAARHDAAHEVLSGVTAGASEAVDEANELLAEACAALDASGRALYAAHADLPLPTDPVRKLWHQLTLVREWRGDGHIAVLVAENVGPCEVLHIHAAAGGPPADVLRLTRGWSEQQWAAARERLVAAGTVTAAGSLTEAGAAHRAHVEDRTDELAAAPWLALGQQRCGRLRELLRPFSEQIVAGGGLGPMLAASQGSTAGAST